MGSRVSGFSREIPALRETTAVNIRLYRFLYNSLWKANFARPITTNVISKTIIKMLAARDQENLTYVHQAAGAAKPLNQGLRQAPPKTPGNKAPKTPFKLPLNDENGIGGIGSLKGGLKVIGKGNENATAGKKGGLGNQNVFVTPMAQKSRAPLGMKTTNAKAKGIQTPAPPKNADLGEKNQKSVSARKSKPRISHAEMTKIDLLADTELDGRDIEYMPPKIKGQALSRAEK